jgi:hypothetical protein
VAARAKLSGYAAAVMLGVMDPHRLLRGKSWYACHFTYGDSEMSSEQERPSPIKPPAKDHPDDRARVPLEAAIALIPGGSSLSKLIGEFFPTRAQKSRGRWEVAISARSNEHTERLDQHERALSPSTVTLTGVSAQLALALARAPGDGMTDDQWMLDDLCKLLLDAARDKVRRAAFELSTHGLVEIERPLGRPGRLVAASYAELL